MPIVVVKQADTGRQAGGHRQASSQTSRQTYWQAGGRLAGRDRQTGGQTQASKQSNTDTHTHTHAHISLSTGRANVTYIFTYMHLSHYILGVRT